MASGASKHGVGRFGWVGFWLPKPKTLNLSKLTGKGFTESKVFGDLVEFKRITASGL